MKNFRTFAFDVGMKSLGVAINENDEIVHADVLLMHEDAGSIKAQAERRRQYRTREAHKAREATLESLWRDIGKEPLGRKRFRKIKNAKGRWEFIKTQADERLEREFPRKGDETVYASCLLRIMLLEGEPMEEWQIYKALHASIQRRGYDSNVPWKTGEKRLEKPAKSENPANQVEEFDTELRKMTPDERYQLPCYYDAWKMGLWSNQTGKITNIRQQYNPQRARKQNPSRDLVIREVSTLLKQAAEQIPPLKEHLTEQKLDALLYGEQRNAIHKQYPSAATISGILGQKYPRFENRIVSKCALIPRLNVCKAEKQLAIDVGFLLRLVNWRYEKEDEEGNRLVASLTGTEMRAKFQECQANWHKKAAQRLLKNANDAEAYAKYFKLSKKQVTKFAESLDGLVKEGHTEIPASKHTGRSRFSQPALHLMKSLILSEKTPQDFYAELSQSLAALEKENPDATFGYRLFPDVPYKYLLGDFAFLDKMGSTRDSIHIPDISLVERYISDDGDVDSAIQKAISSCNWPELRHRLNVFRRELDNLTIEFGKPDAVHLEFIREDFLGEKKKKNYTAQADAGKQANQAARAALKDLNISVTDDNILRYRLCAEQNKQCLYTGEPIDRSRLDSYQIDHIFPEAGGGPDAYYNKMLTSADVNVVQKGNRLPCECDFINWAAYKTRLNSLSLGKNKKRLLLASTREEAAGLVEKYTGLSGTAHIARIARDIVCLRFGWQPGEKGKQQRVFVFSGGLTSKVAKKHDLYQALGDGSKRYQKDRSDHRHHALDAMVISYLYEWARDKEKTTFFKLPDGINAAYFSEKLKEVYPHYVTRIPAALAEQPKRNRESGKHKMNVKEYKNISKDRDERGQWYTNKSETGKGTSQHGYLFYKDKRGKIDSKTIHSFRSPFAVEKEVARKASEILGLFYSGKSIDLPDQKAITATQLGRDTRLGFGNYRIVKINKQKKSVIEYMPKQKNESVCRYRISLAMLQKIMLTNELMAGESFELTKFFIKKGESLNGCYKVDSDPSDGRYYTVIDLQSGEKILIESDPFKRLVNYLHQQKSTGLICQGATVMINGNHKNYINAVEADELPKQHLPAGRYLIQEFSGERIDLISQNGTRYNVNSKILDYAADSSH